jgi:hypothetical protein
MSDKNSDKNSGDPFRRVREKKKNLDSEEDKTNKLRPAVEE